MNLNWKLLLRDVAIVWMATALGGFVVGFTASLFLGPGAMMNPNAQKALIVSNGLLGVVAFTIVGCLRKVDRFRYLFVVALGSWIASAPNILFPAITFVQWLFMPIVIVVMVGIGGGLSLLFVPPPKTSLESGSD